jgi:hypothetical protein
VRGYCRREAISEASFYAWRRELRLRRQEAKAERRPSGRGKKNHSGQQAHSGQRADEPTTRQATFVPITVHQTVGMETGLELVLSGGMVLRLPTSISPASVAALVVELERHGC